MLRFFIPALLLAIIIGSFSFFFYSTDEGEEVGSKLKDYTSEFFDLEKKEISKNHNYELLEFDFNETDENKKWHLILVKVNPQDFNWSFIENEDQEFFSIDEMALSQDCALAINSLFYDTRFQTLGLVVQDGKIIYKKHSGELATGIFYLSEKGIPEIVSQENYLIKDDQITLQAGPILLFENGETEITENANELDARTFIALDQDNFVYLGIVYENPDQNWNGVSFFELSQTLKNSKATLGIDFKSSLNLDGGSSTGLFTQDLYFPEKKIPQNIICLARKD